MPVMQNLLHHYLLQHKRLFLPGIGLFTVEQVPAKLDFSNKTLHPPQSAIQLKQENATNDKRFVRFISTQFGMNDTDAIRHFNDFAFDFKNDIAIHGEAILPGIGKVIKASSSSYSFHPEASLETYFPDLTAERVLRENAAHTVRVGEEERTSVEMQELLAEEPRKDYWWIYAVILGTIATGVIIYYHLTHKV